MSQNQLSLPLKSVAHKTTENNVGLVGIPLIDDLIKAFQPDLLADEQTALPLCDAIRAYLLADTQEQQIGEAFDPINEDLLIALEGLRYLLRFGNLNLVQWSLEWHKEKTTAFIDDYFAEKKKTY